VAEAVRHARAGLGPTLVEALTYRVRGHFAGDDAPYRPAEEVEAWRERDPIRRLEEHLARAGLLAPEVAQAVWSTARAEVEQARRAAQTHPDIEPTDLGLDQLFASPVEGS
jgi:TPP-dependent pyruvate/acetoin dehydrogenase alpha subunit